MEASSPDPGPDVAAVPVETPSLVDAEMLELLGDVEVRIPRGEPRRRVAEVADALAARAPLAEVREKLDAAAEAIWDEETRSSVETAIPGVSEGGPLAQALAYRAALPILARDERIQAPLRQLEPSFAELDDEDLERHGIVLARAATPAIGLDLALMKDEGYYFVSVFPPEGSEGVDIVGKAARWLAKRMTMDGDGPRIAMRRFLALLAEEVELDLPVTARALDLVLAEPMPPLPAQDQLFVALARGLVEEAVAERGFPF